MPNQIARSYQCCEAVKTPGQCSVGAGLHKYPMSQTTERERDLCIVRTLRHDGGEITSQYNTLKENNRRWIKDLNVGAPGGSVG